MMNLIRRLASLFTPRQIRTLEERYLAQAVDAQDLEVRVAALERRQF